MLFLGSGKIWTFEEDDYIPAKYSWSKDDVGIKDE